MNRFVTVALILLALGMTTTRAEYRDWIAEEEATPSRWVPRPKYILLDANAERDSYTLSGGAHENANLYYASPRIGLGWDNYIYHPYLLNYSALLEPGYVWRKTVINGQSSSTDEFAVYGRFNAELLSPKPYATTLSFDRNHDEVHYGFFDTASVDAQNWTVASGYRSEVNPVRVAFHQSHEDALQLFQHTISDENILDLQAQNLRKNNNATYFNYQYSQFNREISSGPRSYQSDNNNHRIDAQDIEHFERSLLKSTLRFVSHENNGETTDDLNGAANYDLDLTDHLHNYEQASYSQYTGDGFDSKQGYASSGLRHLLYDSLTSGVDLHGSWADSSAGPSEVKAASGGITLLEDYTKRLGNWGRLSLSESATFSANHQSTVGSTLLIPNESHVVPANNIIRLSRPRALILVSITDSNNVPLLSGDYTVIHSEPWQIQIIPFGPSNIQPGATVRVSYTIQNEPTDDSTSFANAVQVRLSFWNEMASIYARYSFTDNHTSSKDIIIDNEDVFEAGANFTWRRLTLAADYSDQRSTFFTLSSINLSESYSMDVSHDSTLDITLNQQWDENTSKDGFGSNERQHSTFYNFMLTHDWHPLAQLNWKNEIGYQRQTGFNLEQNLLVARSYLNWSVGKLQISAGYEHEDVDYVHESKLRDYGFLKLRRNF